ncbi:hypothetical protein ACVWV0_001083 [Ewingella americana]|jgi:hypothetical protein|uniref:Uncharacterized protein n=1 Tax=Ewingella americana TaxID=41202 RepID=A0A377N9T1_9GAMM|nr:Uncharacterised protein [Ewingella americana]
MSLFNKGLSPFEEIKRVVVRIVALISVES